MTVLKCKPVKIRKPHRCIWCGQHIEIGEQAQYRVSIWEGEFNAEHFHPECWDALGRSEDVSDGFETMNQLRGKTYEESHP